MNFFFIKIQNFSFRKCIWKYRLRNGDHFYRQWFNCVIRDMDVFGIEWTLFFFTIISYRRFMNMWNAYCSLSFDMIYSPSVTHVQNAVWKQLFYGWITQYLVYHWGLMALYDVIYLGCVFQRQAIAWTNYETIVIWALSNKLQGYYYWNTRLPIKKLHLKMPSVNFVQGSVFFCHWFLHGNCE